MIQTNELSVVEHEDPAAVASGGPWDRRRDELTVGLFRDAVAGTTRQPYDSTAGVFLDACRTADDGPATEVPTTDAPAAPAEPVPAAA